MIPLVQGKRKKGSEQECIQEKSLSLVKSQQARRPKLSPASLCDDILWTEKYRPTKLAAIACHHSKVKAITQWLEGVLQDDRASSVNERPHVLVLGGCSGNGKSTMLDLICEQMHVEQVRWSFDRWESDSGNAGSSSGGSRQPNKLEDLDEFVLRSSYPSLFLGGKVRPESSSSQMPRSRGDFSLTEWRELDLDDKKDRSARRIVVMDDPPHLIGCAQKQTAEFMDRLIEFRKPLVIILSEESAREDIHYSLQSCFSSNLIQKINVESIYCPPVTALKVKKVLEQIVSDEKMKKSQALSAAIDDISTGCLGDLRHAILRLQLFTRCTSSMVNSGGSSGAKSSVSKGASDAIKNNFHRDMVFASLHSVSKILSARMDCAGKININVDAVIDGSDYHGDVLYSFLQGNSVANILRSSRLCCSLENSGVTHEGAPNIAGSGKVPDDVALFQCSDIFSRFSDLDILWYRQFDSSKPIDHADTIFPVAYCQAIAARASATAKGLGETERHQAVKEKGLKSAIAPVYRPKALDCRRNLQVIRSKLMSLRNALATHVSSYPLKSSCRSADGIHIGANLESLSELAVTSVPYLGLLQRNREFPSVVASRLASLTTPLLMGTQQRSLSSSFIKAQSTAPSGLETSTSSILVDDDIAEYDD